MSDTTAKVALHLDRATFANEICGKNTSWKHMPFFLVTQTSLVEAQDEQDAAQTGVDRLRSGGQVTVSVKSDETTITHVVVDAVAEEPLPVGQSEAADPSPAAIAIPEIASATPGSRKLILKRMLADGLALLGRRT
ncbi:hypothetical protein [Agrobacterium salinitolerans]|uniref:hypothetical protein n=1 Tax=Agrobacterium salinitolerans TaxID=1183413 RepID=UPI0020B339F2|nr:hypothetical protein [Agrobacterium salinitolerans]